MTDNISSIPKYEDLEKEFSNKSKNSFLMLFVFIAADTAVIAYILTGNSPDKVIFLITAAELSVIFIFKRFFRYTLSEKKETP